MTIELWSSLGVSLVLFAAILIQQIAIDRKYGATYALSNRASVPVSVSPLVERLTRLVRNHVEGVALFVPLGLIATGAGVSNTFTQAGAIAFLAMRVFHLLFYAAGITPFRSFSWGIGFFVAIPVFLYGLLG